MVSDGRTYDTYIYFVHSCIVYVGLAQARPNKTSQEAHKWIRLFYLLQLYSKVSCGANIMGFPSYYCSTPKLDNKLNVVTWSRESSLSTNYSSITIIPEIIVTTNSGPFIIVTHFKKSFIWNRATNQSDTPIDTAYCGITNRISCRCTMIAPEDVGESLGVYLHVPTWTPTAAYLDLLVTVTLTQWKLHANLWIDSLMNCTITS